MNYQHYLDHPYILPHLELAKLDWFGVFGKWLGTASLQCQFLLLKNSNTTNSLISIAIIKSIVHHSPFLEAIMQSPNPLDSIDKRIHGLSLLLSETELQEYRNSIVLGYTQKVWQDRETDDLVTAVAICETIRHFFPYAELSQDEFKSIFAGFQKVIEEL